MQTIRISLAVAIVFLFLGGCPSPKPADSPPGTPESPHKSGTQLAKVGPSTITVEEFEEKINKQSPFIRARYNDIEKRREYLDNQIQFELLAQEARRRGIDQQLEVQESLNKIMVQKLTREVFESKVKLEDITDQEIEQFFNEHADDYHKPEMVRVAHIFTPFGADKKEAERKAQKLTRELTKNKDDRMAFRKLAAEHSADEETKKSGGDLRYMSMEDYTTQYGAGAAEAVFALAKLNDLSNVVEGKDGYHIFKQTGRRQPIDRQLDQVKTQIRNRLYRDKRTQAFDSFVAELRQRAGVTVDEDKLASINVVGATQPMPGAPHGVPGSPEEFHDTPPTGMKPGLPTPAELPHPAMPAAPAEPPSPAGP